MIMTTKEDLMPLYDFCNIITQDMLDMRDIDNQPKFKVDIDKGSISCSVMNKKVEPVYLIFKGHGVIFIESRERKTVYKITGLNDIQNVIAILTNDFSVELNLTVFRKFVDKEKKEG